MSPIRMQFITLMIWTAVFTVQVACPVKTFLGTPLFGAEDKPAAEKKWNYQVTVSKNDCVVSVELNGVPLVTQDQKDDLSIAVDVSPWIMPEGNAVTVKVAGETKKAGQEKFTAKVKVVLYLAQAGTFAEDKDAVLTYMWPEILTDDEKFFGREQSPPLPLTKSLPFTAPYLPPAELWAKAVPTELTDADKKEIAELIKSYERYLAEKKFEELYQLTVFASQESYRSRNWTFTKEKFDRMAKGAFSDPSLKVLRLPESEYVYLPLCGKRIYRVVTADLKNVLKIKLGEGEGELEINVSKIDGKWMLSR